MLLHRIGYGYGGVAVAMASDRVKAALHTLVDRLPDERAELLLRALRERDSTLLCLAFLPEDDEPITPEEAAALAEVAEDCAPGA